MAAAPMRKRTRRRPSRTIAIGALVGGLALIAAIVWASMAYSGQPSQQQRVALPGMGEHLVNLWVEAADAPEARQLTAQVTDISGWPASVGSVAFAVSGAGQEGIVEAPGIYSADGPGRGQVYRAVTEMPGDGPWQVTVRFTMTGNTGEATFTVQE